MSERRITLEEALQCIEEHLRPPMTVEVWFSRGGIMRRVRLDDHDAEFMCASVSECAAAIRAVATLAPLPDLSGYECYLAEQKATGGESKN